jgi:hypothetical protein
MHRKDLKMNFGHFVLLFASLATSQISIVEAACTSALKNSKEFNRGDLIDSVPSTETPPPPALFRQQKIKPPMGLNEDQMEILLEKLANSPHLRPFDIFVIYGSRVHYDFGSKPSTISDLDIAPIPKDPSSVSPNTYKIARTTASELSELLKVMIKFDLRANNNFSALVQDPDFFNPAPVEEYILAWKDFQLSPGAKLNHALMIKSAWQSFLDEQGLRSWFTKNSIVIFRDPESVEHWVPVLKSKGFHNWIQLP